MSALASPAAAFLALCAKHGVNPNSIPDAPGRRAPKPRQRPRSPDRKASRDRRRRLGGSSALPDTLRQHYTEGQRAVLCIVAGEVKHHGVCDLPIDKMAALAGVCRTTVQTTLHLAKGLKHVAITYRWRKGQKNLPNVVEITSTEWLAWIKRGPSVHRPDRVQKSKMVNPTKSIVDDSGGDAGAKQHAPSARAVSMAAELAKIAGLNPQNLPLSWERHDPARIVDRWMSDLEAVGLKFELLPSWASHVMQRKPEKCPPNSIRYFAPTIDRIINGNRALREQLRRGERHASRRS
jgi:hypothetical protein